MDTVKLRKNVDTQKLCSAPVQALIRLFLGPFAHTCLSENRINMVWGSNWRFFFFFRLLPAVGYKLGFLL